MSEKRKYCKFSITVYSYEDVVEKFKKRNNLSNEEVRDRLEQELQVNAWADAYPGMQDYLDWENSPEGKKYIEELKQLDR